MSVSSPAISKRRKDGRFGFSDEEWKQFKEELGRQMLQDFEASIKFYAKYPDAIHRMERRLDKVIDVMTKAGATKIQRTFV